MGCGCVYFFNLLKTSTVLLGDGYFVILHEFSIVHLLVHACSVELSQAVSSGAFYSWSTFFVSKNIIVQMISLHYFCMNKQQIVHKSKTNIIYFEATLYDHSENWMSPNMHFTLINVIIIIVISSRSRSITHVLCVGFPVCLNYSFPYQHNSIVCAVWRL